jgi:hypothetical protein
VASTADPTFFAISEEISSTLIEDISLNTSKATKLTAIQE